MAYCHWEINLAKSKQCGLTPSRELRMQHEGFDVNDAVQCGLVAFLPNTVYM